MINVFNGMISNIVFMTSLNTVLGSCYADFNVERDYMVIVFIKGIQQCLLIICKYLSVSCHFSLLLLMIISLSYYREGKD